MRQEEKIERLLENYGWDYILALLELNEVKILTYLDESGYICLETILEDNEWD
jgi:hypothetical protein